MCIRDRRITDPDTGQHVGVMKAVLGVSLIQEVADQRAADVPGGNVTVVNNNGLLLAETRSNHAQNRVMVSSVNLGSALPAISRQVEADDDGYVLLDDVVAGFASSAAGSYYDAVIPDFPGFGWKVIVEQPTEIAFSPLEELNTVQLSMEESRDTLLLILLGTAIVVVLVAVMLATSLSRGIIEPIKDLQGLAERVSKGDTSHQIQINTDDEIQDLAQIFDRMRSSLAIILKRYQEMRRRQG